MRLLNSVEYIQKLKPTSRDTYGNKRNLNGYNVFLRYFFSNFKILTDDDQAELLCDLEAHSREMYTLSEEDSIFSLPEVTTVHIIKAAAIEWNKMESDAKNAWKLLAVEINNLPILGAFTSIPTDIEEQDIKVALSRDHHRFISIIRNLVLRKKKTSMKKSTKRKKFGKEHIEIGAMVYKSFFLSHLLKICFFGHNYALLFHRSEVVEKTKKTIIVHIKSMERLVRLFYCNGVSAFSYKDQVGLVYSLAGKVVLKNNKSKKKAIGYIIQDKKILTESGTSINVEDICLPVFVRGDGSWSYRYDDEERIYSVAEYQPIRLKICDSGNCQILSSRIVLSNDQSKLINNK